MLWTKTILCYNIRMGRQIKTKGIVLHEMPIGDYDKRLILLTKEQGKVTVFVKGARRSNNKLLAVSQIFAYGDFVLAQGKNSYNVYQADLIESFHYLRTDIEVMTYGMYMLEFIDFVAKDEMENQSLMHWLLLSLHVLEKKLMPVRLVVRIFELRAMSIIGFTPWLNDCILCHKHELKYFSPEEGGVICSDRTHDLRDLIRLHEGTLHAMRYVLTQPLKNAYSFELEIPELLEFEQIMTQFLWTNFNKKFKTMEFLKQL